MAAGKLVLTMARRTDPTRKLRRQMKLSKAIRVLAAVGVIAATAVVAGPADANHSINFYECSSNPSPPPSLQPELTPPPTDPPPDVEEPPGATPTPAPQYCMPSQGERLWGNRLIRFLVETDTARPLSRVSMSILSGEEGIADPNSGDPVVNETFPRCGDARRIAYSDPFSWNTVELTPRNGRYKVHVEAEAYQPSIGCSSTATHAATPAERVDLRVDNPPKRVDAPKILATTPTTVDIQWTPGTELDVTSYSIFRATTANATTKPKYSDFKQVGTSTSAGFRDTKVTPGVHWYAVKVTRRSVVTPDTGISSVFSPVSSTAATVTAADATPGPDATEGPRRFIPDFRRAQVPRSAGRASQVPDAPFAYKLPYNDAPDGTVDFGESEEAGGGTDSRGATLYIAVGAFLVSAALALGRMPY